MSSRGCPWGVVSKPPFCRGPWSPYLNPTQKACSFLLLKLKGKPLFFLAGGGGGGEEGEEGVRYSKPRLGAERLNPLNWATSSNSFEFPLAELKEVPTDARGTQGTWAVRVPDSNWFALKGPGLFRFSSGSHGN